MKIIYFCCAQFVFLSLSSFHAHAFEENTMIDDFRSDILSEIYHSHGTQIQLGSFLSWCGLDELANEVSLTGDELDRAIYDSTVVSGTQNIAAIEYVRSLNDADWKEFRSSIYSGLSQYKIGLVDSVDYFLEDNNYFCTSIEKKAIESVRVLSVN